MSYAVCCVPVSSIRALPSHDSEMVTQQLFGECCMVTERFKGHWVKIICKYDGMEGWCSDSHITEIDEAHYRRGERDLTADWVNEVSYNGHMMMLPFGSSLTAMKNGAAIWRKNLVNYKGKVWSPYDVTLNAKNIKQVAFTFLNTAYLWGGKSVFGVDCSGYVQSIYKCMGIPLLRNARQQVNEGELVGFLEEATCGDLAFFDDENGNINHVGMLLNTHEIIHASGKVRIDGIDNMGIVHSENAQRTHQLRVIKRMALIQ